MTTNRHRRHHVAVDDDACGAHVRGRYRGDCHYCDYFDDHVCGGGEATNGVYHVVAVAVDVADVDGACHYQILSQLPRPTT